MAARALRLSGDWPQAGVGCERTLIERKQPPSLISPSCTCRPYRPEISLRDGLEAKDVASASAPRMASCGRRSDTTGENLPLLIAIVVSFLWNLSSDGD